MKIVLMDERTKSWNTYYSGTHWAQRKAEATRVHTLVRSELGRYPIMFLGPVNIVITAYFKNRPQDPDNICAKLYIDGLVGAVIEDDTARYVSSVTTKSRVDKKRPRVEIEVNEVRQ